MSNNETLGMEQSVVAPLPSGSEGEGDDIYICYKPSYQASSSDINNVSVTNANIENQYTHGNYLDPTSIVYSQYHPEYTNNNIKPSDQNVVIYNQPNSLENDVNPPHNMYSSGSELMVPVQSTQPFVKPNSVISPLTDPPSNNAVSIPSIILHIDPQRPNVRQSNTINQSQGISNLKNVLNFFKFIRTLKRSDLATPKRSGEQTVFMITITVLLCVSLFIVCGILFGIPNSDLKILNDPEAISYIHKGCCNIINHFCDVDNRCDFTVQFKSIKSFFEKDSSHGYGIDCNSASSESVKLKKSQQLTKPISSMQMYNIDCFTDKLETEVRIVSPYSELYYTYRVGGVICVCVGISLLVVSIIFIGRLFRIVLLRYKNSHFYSSRGIF